MSKALVFKLLRALALTAVALFFLFPILWVFMMSFMTNADILRSPPSPVFTPTLDNYRGLLTGQLDLTLPETPRTETYFIDSGAELGGIGEVGPLGIPAALSNAIFAATGKRLRTLPLMALLLSYLEIRPERSLGAVFGDPSRLWEYDPDNPGSSRRGR